MNQSPQSDRPLSPHLQIYKWQLTSVLSITHRMTGVALSLGTLVLVLWFAALAWHQPSFEVLSELFHSTLGRISLLLWCWSLLYHLANGIRHLLWDMGRGLSLPAVYRTGWLVIAIATFGTLMIWFNFMCSCNNVCYVK